MKCVVESRDADKQVQEKNDRKLNVFSVQWTSMMQEGI